MLILNTFVVLAIVWYSNDNELNDSEIFFATMQNIEHLKMIILLTTFILVTHS